MAPTIPDPKDFTEPDKLRKLMANAIRLGHPDLAFRCQTRIAELVGLTHEAGVEREFFTALAWVEEFKAHETGKKATQLRTRQKYKRSGAVSVLEEWVAAPETSAGFAALLEHGRADMTGEAVVIRHPEDFTATALSAAKIKLAQVGMDQVTEAMSEAAA